MLVFWFGLSACVNKELCMKDVQGEWVVKEVTIQRDSCNASSIWSDYYDEPYTFRGSYSNAVRGPVNCYFDNPSRSTFYCEEIFPNVYKRAWGDDFLEWSTAPGAWADVCDGINTIEFFGSTEGILTEDNELLLQFYGNAYCPSFDGQSGADCDVDIQWVLKRADAP